jgi:nicotinate dehydrogenase subunit B
VAVGYNHIGQAPAVKREVPVVTGEIDAAFADPARVVEAEYEWPFQSHASMGPACAVVDARADGATLWTGSQKPHFARRGCPRARSAARQGARDLGPGPGLLWAQRRRRRRDRRSFAVKGGRSPGARAGHALRGPRLDPKGPASIHRARAALDEDGAVLGYAFENKGFSRIDIDTNESDPAYSLAGQLILPR